MYEFYHHPNGKHHLKSLKWWLTSRAPGKSKPFPLKIAKLPKQTISSSNHWFLLNFQVILLVLGRVTSWGILLISKVRHSTDFWFWNIQQTAKPSQKTGWMISVKKKTCQILHHLRLFQKGKFQDPIARIITRKSEVLRLVPAMWIEMQITFVGWRCSFQAALHLVNLSQAHPYKFVTFQSISLNLERSCAFYLPLRYANTDDWNRAMMWEQASMAVEPREFTPTNRAESPEHQTTNTLFFGCILEYVSKCHVRCWVKDFEYPILWQKLT